jgi:hypothetical protein
MILFDWHKVKFHADGKASNIMLIMHAITWPYVLPSYRMRKVNPFYDIDFNGHSFLLDPERFLNRRDVPLTKRVEYVSLASRRCYAEYLLSGEKTLDCRLVKRPIDNELLTVKTNRVCFAYE